MGGFLILVGMAVNIICGVVLVVKAFKVSVGWGLAVLFIPFAAIIFVFNHWQETKMSFLGSIGSGGLMILGILISASSVPDQPVETTASRRSSSRTSDDRPSTYNPASASASYQPPRTAYAPSSSTSTNSSYVPAYNPPPLTLTSPATHTDTAMEDEWTRKPVYEQVYVDRETGLFYAAKCKKRPENVYRIPRTVAVNQGMTEAQCK